MAQATSDLVDLPEAERRYTERQISSSDGLVASVRQSTTHTVWSVPDLESFHNHQAQRGGHTIEVGTCDDLGWNPGFMEPEGHEFVDPMTLFDGLPYFDTGSTTS
jgi:hypothetical protein